MNGNVKMQIWQRKFLVMLGSFVEELIESSVSGPAVALGVEVMIGSEVTLASRYQVSLAFPLIVVMLGLGWPPSDLGWPYRPVYQFLIDT